MTGKILWHVTMSLDGFIAGPHDEMAWSFEYGMAGPTGDEVIAETGAILAGRRGFGLGTKPGRGPRAVYGGRWSGPFFVLTHRPPAVSDNESITYLSGSIQDAVATARAAAKGKSVGIFGASVAKQCLEHELLDEIIIHLVPVLLGNGIHLFETRGNRQVRLERTFLSGAGQITDLRFRIVK